MLENFQIRLAVLEDFGSVLELLKAIAKWMKNNGINQWQFLLSGGDDKEIRKAIVHNETFILLRDKEVIGTFTLSASQSEWDQHIFGKEKRSDSLYLHRLAIAPAYMGNGLGKEILEWIQMNIRTEKVSLKLNCVAGNSKLNQFYKDHGFEYIGETDHHSKYRNYYYSNSLF